MAADPDLEFIKEQIALIGLHAQADMDQDQARAFAIATWEMQDKYEKAQAILKDKNATAADQKYAKDVTDSINKNLPNLVKGVLSAASAFKSGDYINGSAAIMDICASGVQMLASLSAGAGPYGAVFGAIFTIIGQLLTYFGPKQPSLKDQIIDAIKGLNAEEKLRNTKADGDAVQEYTTTIYRIRSLLPKHLQNPITTSEELWNFRTLLEADILAIKLAFQKVSSLYRKWETAEWLRDEKTQDLEKWPEILGVFCRTYSDSLLANLALASMANQTLVDQRLKEVSSTNPNYAQFQHDFDEVNNLLIKLRAIVLALPETWNDGNNLMRQFVKDVEPVARSRGLYLHLGTDKYLYAATGKKSIESSAWKNLPIGYGARGHRFSVTVPKSDAGSLKPVYHVFFAEHWLASDSGDLEHGRIEPATVAISGQQMISPDKFHDIWALPSPEDPRKSFVYAAHNAGEHGSVKLFELDTENNFKTINWNPSANSRIVNIRAITHPPMPLPDDPDKGALPPGSLLVRGTDHYNSIVYGALASTGSIYVDQSNTRCAVPSPWDSYSGIDADPYYLWVFRPQGFACATHASVINCIQGKIKSPRWMECSANDLIGDQSRHDGNKWLVDFQGMLETKTYPPLKGLISLSPCRDGTLFASAFQRTVKKVQSGDHWLFIANDSLASYTAPYTLKPGSLQAGPWTKCSGAALQVQKMPIPCWSLFEGLKADIQTKGILRQAS
ncbi:hypothetical protein WKW79_22690 [Variovorax robiniae]|uniref:Pesticidal crystal protein N-terminal domain-containing protein n=1 Tax=Variovorax robiniae TaxID=1836199 RepID=A0ABU8XC78_9BURK